MISEAFWLSSVERGFTPLRGTISLIKKKKLVDLIPLCKLEIWAIKSKDWRNFFQQIFGGHLEFWKSQAEGNFPYNRNWVFRHRSIILCKKKFKVYATARFGPLLPDYINIWSMRVHELSVMRVGKCIFGTKPLDISKVT